MKRQTLDYIRPATVKKDSYNGFLYLHRFDAGFQYLIFPSHEAAKKFEQKMNDETYLKKPA